MTYSLSDHDIWQSDRLIIICYAAGNRGRAIDRMLSLSPEIGKPESYPAVFASGTAHGSDGWLMAPDGSFWNPLSRVADEWNNWQHWTASDIGRIKADVLSSMDCDLLCRHLQNGGRMSMISHAHVSVMRQIWPKAVYIKPLWRDGGQRQFRDFVQKMLYHRPVGELDQRAHHLIEHTLLDERDCQLDAICRQRFDTTNVTNSLRKAVLRDYWGMEIQSINRDAQEAGIIEVSLADLFHQMHWMDAYLMLCKQLRITANEPGVSAFMREYLPLQWRRSAA